jgi:DNA-binding transcriptional MerR regulator
LIGKIILTLPANLEGYTPSQVSKLVGLPLRTLDSWDRSGLIKPSLRQSRGRGGVREYHFNDLIALKIAVKLRTKGISIQSVRKIMDYLNQRYRNDFYLSNTLLVADNTNVYEPQNDVELLSLLKKPGQCVFIFALDVRPIREELSNRIKEIRSAA